MRDATRQFFTVPTRCGEMRPRWKCHLGDRRTHCTSRIVRNMAVPAKADIREPYLTVAEVAERLKVNEDTVRRLFGDEPGVLVICFPRRGRRVYRTLRIPESVYLRVLMRLTKVA